MRIGRRGRRIGVSVQVQLERHALLDIAVDDTDLSSEEHLRYSKGI